MWEKAKAVSPKQTQMDILGIEIPKCLESWDKKCRPCPNQPSLYLKKVPKHNY